MKKKIITIVVILLIIIIGIGTYFIIKANNLEKYREKIVTVRGMGYKFEE